MPKADNHNSRVITNSKTQVNFTVPNDLLEKIKDLAFWEATTQSEIYYKSVVKFLELYEGKHGKIKERPIGKGLDSI